MTTLIVRLGTVDDAKARFVEAGRHALAENAVDSTPSVNFVTYDEMHRVLTPSRLAIVRTLAGQGALSIREVAGRVNRDVQAVHRDVATLVNAGVIDRTADGIEFPYDRIHFEYDVSAAA
jgi:predicted transcriptional regulator